MKRSATKLGAALLLAAITANAALAADVVGERPIVPPGATAILLASVAGDVESERMFSDQLRGWLEVLEAQASPPRRVVVLRDGEFAVPSSTKLPVEVSAATRAEFLALGAKLAGNTGPLLVVAFGHGGMQGATPVLHVRGPRLTAPDFKTFADRMPQAESHWLLFFRGSGAFAAELAGPHRSIIASERDTPFSNDPVGASLVLKSLRANPGIAFSALADELGRATAAWYADRHLARTEDPTLWPPGQPPRVLTPAENKGPLASRPARTEPPAPPKSELSAEWKSLARADAKNYPGADGVVLRRNVSYTLGSSPAIAAENDEFIQVLTAAGKRLGDFDFAFSPPHEDLTFLACEVLRPDGTLARLDPDEIRETGGSAPGDYKLGRRKMFSLPGVAPGAVLHVHYRSEWKTFPLPHISLSIPIASELPVNDLAVRVTVGGKAPFYFAFDHATPRDPQIKQGAYGTDYSWRFEHVPAEVRETLGPPHAAPAVAISTWPDWAEFAAWYSRIIKLADQPGPEIAAKARELTRGAGSDREKVRAIYDYVTGLRYVAIPLGVNSFRPHAAANVFKNQFGDCKDKANLFNTLLRAVNVDACLVLVPRFSQAHAAVPGFAFNHAISRVALGGETIWVDTTDDVCRFGLLPPGDSGRNVLAVDGKSTALSRLPPPAPNDHRLRLSAQVNCTALAGALPVSVELTTQGFADYQLRTVASGLSRRQSGQPLLAAQFRLANGSFAMDKQTFTPASALNEEFGWSATGQIIGIASDNSRLLRPPFWVPREWDSALHRRTTPLYLNQGYPLTLDETITFALPTGTSGTGPTATSENVQPPLRWKLAWSHHVDEQLVATLRVELSDGELSAEETVAFQQQLRALLDALARGASITTAK